MGIDHLESGPFNQFNKFSVSQSGAIGLACWKVKPSLSVLNSNTSEPNVLSHEKFYHSSVFVKMSGQEYLAATCLNTNTVELWDFETQTSSPVYTEQTDGMKKNLCVIDDRTVACQDGSSKIHIIKTDSGEWKLGSVVDIEKLMDFEDMCFIKTSDGTSCLLVCCPGLVMAIEIVGGHIKWSSGEDQMGEGVSPVSLCVIGNTVCVADAQKHKIHVLSVEDGYHIQSISLNQYGIINPICVRSQDGSLFVEHLDDKYEKHSISQIAWACANTDVSSP